MAFEHVTGSNEAVQAMCAEHGPYIKASIKLHSGEIWARCPACEEEREREYQERNRRQQDQQRRDSISRNRKECAVPLRFAQCSFENLCATTKGHQDAIVMASSFAKNFNHMIALGASLTLCGKPGTGKTHLAAAIANYLLPLGFSVLYRCTYPLLREIKDTWSKRSERTQTEIIRRLCRVDLLILDEVGVQFSTDTDKTLLFEILDGRYQDRKPSVVCSNLDRIGLTDFLGERILDRLMEKGSAVIICDWNSFRSDFLTVTSDSGVVA